MATQVEAQAHTEKVAQFSAPMVKGGAQVAKPPLPGWRIFTIIFSSTLFMVINIFIGSGFSLTLPSISEDLNIPQASLQWVISSYTLTSGCFLLPFGRLADLHGRRRVFLAGAAWVAVWSVGCGFAKNEISLDVMRAFQGMGIAAGLPAGLGVLAQTFEVGSRLRTVAFSTFGCGAPLGSALGFTMGGVLTQKTSAHWRSAFFFSAGLAGLTFVTGWLAIDKDTHHLDPSLDRRVDWMGAFLVTSSLILLTFSLGDVETAPDGWKTSYIIALLVLSIVLLCAFILWEKRLGWQISRRLSSSVTLTPTETFLDNLLTIPPMLNLDLFTRAHGRMAAMQALAFFVWAGFSSCYQNYLGLSPIHAMLRMLPMSITGVILNGIVALAVAHIEGIVLIVTGCVMAGLAPLLFAIIDPLATYWVFGFPAAIFGVFGADFIFASGSLFVAKVARLDEQSVAGGLFTTLTQVGTSVGLALSSIVLNQMVARNIQSLGPQETSSSKPSSSTPKSALLEGYRAVQWLNFSFMMVGLVLALVFLRHIGVIARMGEANLEEDAVAETLSLEDEKVGKQS
ncbi:efflux transporter [Cantharellus anzutake]|uniref:efflux transporter n=1 Tax=Cantharellus anzutake TaxID=1750568 RepID=UPI001908AA37|nr:efflux transporter [Cantharellus anzutake]KAF8340762.1 efflux transporter [Cantharellus anzutake]